MSCRRMHKQEMLELRQQVKTASVSNKGGEKESDRLKKELDKARFGIHTQQLAFLVEHHSHYQLPAVVYQMQQSCCWPHSPRHGTQAGCKFALPAASCHLSAPCISANCIHEHVVIYHHACCCSTHQQHDLFATCTAGGCTNLAGS